MSEQTPLLKIRVIVLSGVLIVEMLETHWAMLGVNSENKVQLKSPLSEIVNQFKVALYPGADFADVKKILTEFADNNAFFGDMKPVPRIEFNQDEDSFELTYLEQSRKISTSEMEAIRKVFDSNKTFPLKQKKVEPRFTSKWKQISNVRHISLNEFPNLLGFSEQQRHMTVVQLSPTADLLRKDLTLLKAENKTEFIEIWEFEINYV